MVEYKYVNKKIIGGKAKCIYKKQGSNKQYLKNKGKMMRVTEYRKKVSNKKKGGAFFSIDGTIKDLKRIEIGTYQGNNDNMLALNHKTKKRSLKVILKNENGKTINSDNFTGFVDFPVIKIKPDGSISANIILVIFQNNNNEMLKNAKTLQKAYQKLDYHLSEVTRSNVKYDYDDVKVEKLEDGTKYAVCSIDDVKYAGNSSIDAQEFRNIPDGKIKSAFITNLQNAGVDENKNTKVFYINNITFTSNNCKELQALIKTGNQVYQMLPKMATSTTDKLNKEGYTPFLKVMVPSIWYTAPNPPQENIDYHKQLQLNLIMHLMRKIQRTRPSTTRGYLFPSSLFTGIWGGVFSFAGAIAVTGSAMGAFSMVFGPMLVVGSSLALSFIMKEKMQTMKFANKEIKKMGDNLNELPYQNMMLTEQIQRQPPQQQSLQRQSPQQQFQRQSPQQPFQRQSPQQQFQRQSPQQPRIVQPQQFQRAPPQQQRAPQQPQRAQSVPRAAWHQSTQVGGKLKKKKNANKKQKK